MRMASHHIGSDALIHIRTGKVSVILKGPASHPNFQGIACTEQTSEVRVVCSDSFACSLRGEERDEGLLKGRAYTGLYETAPLFFEQQRYELIIEAADGHSISFWHDNLKLRQSVTPSGFYHNNLSGIINFGNEIGSSELVIRVDGENYLRVLIEVFPTKISYREDYQAIVEDVTNEVYNLVFDFLKKTYAGYQQGHRMSSSPVEFFAIIRRIYRDFIKAADLILSQPHHLLETSHTVMPGHRVTRADSRSLRWLEKHPEQMRRTGGRILVDHMLAVKKRVTYDTKENRLTKFMLESVAKKLESFKRLYLRLQRTSDAEFVREVDEMARNIARRSSASFLREVEAQTPAAGMSLVFSMAPGYRDLYKYYLMLLRGLAVTGEVFHISVKDLAVLYEYWCFIKLNRLMKDKYQLISQDLIRVQGNGLYVSLVKGHNSRVKYRNPVNNEKIVLSYNPKIIDVPTVTQRPDNVLTLEKHGANVDYEYVFDAKYRVNPALPGTDYYTAISHRPGPEVDDINTMHRYRDAIVSESGASPYERLMFGAYVLFPYHNEQEYLEHKFYKSIDKVNIGGLPFLPSATGLVSKLLDELISDSPDSAFERATLPKGIEAKLAKVDWSVRDVLVGSLKNKEQLNLCLSHRFYHIPAQQLKTEDFPIRFVALYQSRNLFNTQAGIRYVGEVISCTRVPRKEIREIPKNSDEMYYRFNIKEWTELPKAILPKEAGGIRFFTNRFLLEHSALVPELKLKSEAEYRLYSELKRATESTEINDSESNICFNYQNVKFVFDAGKINVYRQGKLMAQKTIEEFGRSPGAVFYSLQSLLR